MTLEDYGIEIKGRKTTGQAVALCPKCSESRKKKNDPCLSVNLDLGVWNCKNCGWTGSLKKKVYALPVWENKTALPDAIVEWFLKRNISQSVLSEMKVSYSDTFMPQVSENRKVMCFNYFREGALVNTKYRDREKNFKLHKDAELILYNFDGINGQKEIYITEGECDALVMIQAGFKNTCSVPNGANPKNNNLQYMDNCWKAFEQAEKVFIMTDNDDPGNQLADELARRLGVERCYRIKHDQKDINDAVNLGLKITKEWLDAHSSFYPLVGIHQAENFWEDLLSIRKNGFPKGWKPRGALGEKISIHPGYQSIVTGIPGHGKSEHLDQLLIELGIDYGLRGAYFSPENFPTSIHLIKIIEKITGRNFWELNLNEINETKEWINDHIYWAYPDDGLTLTNILSHVRKAVLRYGINWYVIDPWNKIDHQFEGSETAYISRCLDEIDVFNKKNNVHSFLIAHPTKMDKDGQGNYTVPNLYSISGSAHFFNKADLGWTVYKTGVGTTDVHIQKVKFKYWGEQGLINYIWEQKNGRYYTINPDNSNWIKPKEVLIDFTEPKNIQDDLPF